MTTEFDAYYKWLGIPPKDQPPNNYRLLGVEIFESDLDVIAGAADQRMSHLRSYQTGPHSALSQKILNEIAAARIRLLNPKKKIEYDAFLQQCLSPASNGGPPGDGHFEKAISPPSRQTQNSDTAVDFGVAITAPARPRQKKRSPNAVLMPLAAILTCIGGAVVWLAIQRTDQSHPLQLSPPRPTVPGPSPKPIEPKIAIDHPSSLPEKPGKNVKGPPAAGDKQAAAQAGSFAPKDNGGSLSKHNGNSKNPAGAPPPSKPAPSVAANKGTERRALQKVTNSTAKKKTPIPKDDEQRRALARAKELYGGRIETSQDIAVVEELLKESRKIGNDAVEYVLMDLAKNIAVRAGEIESAFKVIEEIDWTFEINVQSMKIKAVTDFSNLAKTPREKAIVADDTFDLAQEAMRKGDFEVAKQLMEIASQAAQKSGDKGLIGWISGQKSENERIVSWAARLEKEPNDAEANLELGRYFCFVKGDLNRGRSLMARSGDPELSRLAERESRSAANGQEQADLGTEWCRLSQKKEGDFKKELQNHAADCYRKALASLDGLQQTAVQDRLREIVERIESGKKSTSNLSKTPYFWRKEPTRTAYLRQYGGNSKTERAVEAGLDWLARHQSSDGSWSIDNFCRSKSCTGEGKGQNANAAAGTALGLLPFLAAGHTQLSKGRYKNRINQALNWLVMHQAANGDLSAGGPQQMYSHGLATMALCEAYGMTKDPKLGHAARGAVNFILSAQNAQGGWRYRSNDSGSDISVFGWQMMGLNDADLANVGGDFAKIEKARRWLDTVHAGVKDSRSQGLFSYEVGKPPSPSATAIGLLVRQHSGTSKNDPLIIKGTHYLISNSPESKTQDVYYWYYATQVMHNLGDADWDKWNRKIRKILMETQCNSGCAAGSWDPNSPFKDKWGEHGGRVMMTSLSLLTLEIYYRYPPVHDR